MGSFGPLEIILIFLVVLLIFGAKRIPEIARGIGKGIREFKDATGEISRELEAEGHDRQINQPEAPQQGQPQARQSQQPSPESTAEPSASDNASSDDASSDASSSNAADPSKSTA
ncbi:MAG: twin-arginine translocase TatA/TatE family subunit [Bacteroidetes bacterium SW_9_63_38]|nr:MAG: twin-arginine translocase TatA/TatE family subunit [Bacteroidetes bacterium SW_9_63_38]